MVSSAAVGRPLERQSAAAHRAKGAMAGASPVAAPPPSDEERTVDWCIHALNAIYDEARLVEALALLGEALAAQDDALVDQGQIRRLGRVLRRAGCVELLAGPLVRHTSPDVHTCALLVLGNLAADDLDPESALKVKGIVRATDGAVRTIVRHLFSPREDTLMYALGCLMNVVGAVQDAAIINEEEALQKLMELSSCGDKQLEAFASGTLQNMQASLRRELHERDASRLFAKSLYVSAATAIQATTRGWRVRRVVRSELRRRRKERLRKLKQPAAAAASSGVQSARDASRAGTPSSSSGRSTRPSSAAPLGEALAAASLPKALMKMHKGVGDVGAAVMGQMGASEAWAAQPGVKKSQAASRPPIGLDSPTGRAMRRNWEKPTHQPRVNDEHTGADDMRSQPPRPPRAPTTSAVTSVHASQDRTASAAAAAMEVGWGAISAEANDALLERPMLQLALIDALAERKEKEAEVDQLVDALRGSLAAQRAAEAERVKLQLALEAQASLRQAQIDAEAARRRAVEEQLFSVTSAHSTPRLDSSGGGAPVAALPPEAGYERPLAPPFGAKRRPSAEYAVEEEVHDTRESISARGAAPPSTEQPSEQPSEQPTEQRVVQPADQREAQYKAQHKAEEPQPAAASAEAPAATEAATPTPPTPPSAPTPPRSANSAVALSVAPSDPAASMTSQHSLTTIDETLRPSPIAIKPSELDAAHGSLSSHGSIGSASEHAVGSPLLRGSMAAALATPVRHSNGMWSSPVPVRKAGLAKALAYANHGVDLAECAPPPPRPAAAPPKGSGRPRAERAAVEEMLASHPAFRGSTNDGGVVDNAVEALSSAAAAMPSLLQQMPSSLFVMETQSEADSEEVEQVDPLRRKGTSRSRQSSACGSPNILQVRWGGGLSGDDDGASVATWSIAGSRPNSGGSASTYASSSRAIDQLEWLADAPAASPLETTPTPSVDASQRPSVAAPPAALEPKPPAGAPSRRGSFLGGARVAAALGPLGRAVMRTSKPGAQAAS